MFTDKRLFPIDDKQAYVGDDGTRYPGNYPKREIKGLFKVKETPRPIVDSSLVVTGFYISEDHEQVWETRAKTDVELKQEADDKRRLALSQKWPDPFDLLDDILSRGVEPVKAERDAIKAANPKGAQ